ncbi:hypothetical protein MTER_27010 [Mycolicibacter terrae]|uniref:Uncharacterized protein n=1 Tax=Mycolicibacter terrae TaxID=1788 RepID=A0AAD1MIL3_9MYCO|nr:hypothetical protein MTER_27010 [Mycolicibacter terrae]
MTWGAEIRIGGGGPAPLRLDEVHDLHLMGQMLRMWRVRQANRTASAGHPGAKPTVSSGPAHKIAVI